MSFSVSKFFSKFYFYIRYVIEIQSEKNKKKYLVASYGLQ